MSLLKTLRKDDIERKAPCESKVLFCTQKGSCRECIYAFRGGGIGDGGTDQSVPYEKTGCYQFLFTGQLR